MHHGYPQVAHYKSLLCLYSTATLHGSVLTSAAVLERGDGTLSALMQRAERIIDCVKPCKASEAKRRYDCCCLWRFCCVTFGHSYCLPRPLLCVRRVYHFVRDIVRRAIGAAVFTSGSTPLKTYLPDGVFACFPVDGLIHPPSIRFPDSAVAFVWLNGPLTGHIACAWFR